MFSLLDPSFQFLSYKFTNNEIVILMELKEKASKPKDTRDCRIGGKLAMDATILKK